MSLRRSPVTSQGPQGPRTMNSLRSRRPPPNLNLIVANPDSDEDESDTSQEGRRPSGPIAGANNVNTTSTSNTNVSSGNMPGAGTSRIFQQSGPGVNQGFTITAQPPTPGLPLSSPPAPVAGSGPVSSSSNMAGSSANTTSNQRTGDQGSQGYGNERARISLDDAPQYYDLPSSSMPPKPLYPSVSSSRRPGSSGSGGHSPTMTTNMALPNNASVLPGMMTASNVRVTRTSNAERSLPRIHTPPAYPIPLPPPFPSSAATTARPGLSYGEGVPAPQSASYFTYPGQKSNANVGALIGESPIQSASPSSPNHPGSGMVPGSMNNTMGYAGGVNTMSTDDRRRRHEGLPILPPRPKQNIIAGSGTLPPNQILNQSTPQAQGNGTSNGSPQRLGSIRLAVTVDNENFSVVDVSGMASAEAIMERVFAKLRFRDDDYPSLTLYRTDIGETPESDAVGRAQLFELCKAQGDAKGSLKFLVMQTSMVPSPSSAAIPPPTGHSVAHGGPSMGPPSHSLGSPAELSRKAFSASSAGAAERMRAGYGAGGGGGGSRHSKSGSVSSTSDKLGRQDYGYAHDFGYETSPVDTSSHPHAIQGMQSGTSASGSASGTGNHTLSRHHRLMSKSSRRMPSTSTSKGSQSPADERNKGVPRSYGSPPPSLDAMSGTQTSTSASLSTALGSRGEVLHHPSRRGNTAPAYGDKNESRIPSGSSNSNYHRPSLPTPYDHMYPRPPMDSPENDAEGVPAFDRSYEAVEWEPSPSEPTEADMILIQRMQQEEDERERQKRIQMEDDMRVAMQEQQKEHAAWEAQQAREQEARHRQVEADRVAAERAEENERRFVESDRDRADRLKREAEALEKERERQVGRERKARRLQWENKAGIWNPGLSTFGSDDLPPVTQNQSPLDSRYDHPFGPSSASTSNSRPIPVDDPRVRNANMAGYGSPPLRDTYMATPPIDPDDPFGAYDGLQAHLPPGATYGYRVEPAYRDRDRQPMYHAQSGPVPHVSQPLRTNRSYANINRSASAQPAYEQGQYYDNRTVGRHAASHPPIETDPIYRNDLARVRSAEGARQYSGQRSNLPTLAFPEPHPAAAMRMDRRGSESAAQIPISPSSSHSRRASFGQGIVAYREDQRSDADALSSLEITQQPRSQQPLSDIPARASASTLQQEYYSSREQDQEDDSGNTARANQWTAQLNAMIDGQDEGTLTAPTAASPTEPEEDQAEETLFFVPMGNDKGPIGPDKNDLTIKPSLTVDTSTTRPNLAPHSAHPTSNSSSDLPTAATLESESIKEGGHGAGLRRAKSFAQTKDQWNFRPPAEDVYDRLEEFFPKIDLDKPVVAPVLDAVAEQPAQPIETIQTPALNAKQTRPHGFNKADLRKSIRFVAEGRKKHLSKIAPAVKQQGSSLERKRSSSMWGHKLVEVTPAGIEQGKLPPAPIEEVASDGNPVTMTWVKGDLIGKGTYGRVYLGLNATTGDMIAVKQVEMPRNDTEREDARQTGMIEALKSEIALLKDLDHPQVVAYLGWEESEDFLSIFLEYVPGGSVASVYRKHKKFEEQVIKSFTMQILDGLAYLHSLNILHRDLKADNILVDHNGICKISDFGISKRTNDAYDSIISTNLKGSVFWMAPEVVHSVKGQGYSAKVDIWSLGCVVLEMWAGRRPWGDMEALAAMFQLANTRAAPPVPEDVTLSSDADDFLNKKCFASNPRDRPVAEELLLHPFITDRDPNWTFMDSKIGKAVAAGTKRKRIEPSQG